MIKIGPVELDNATVYFAATILSYILSCSIDYEKYLIYIRFAFIAAAGVVFVLHLAMALISMAKASDETVSLPMYETNSNFLFPLIYFFTNSRPNQTMTTIPSMTYDLFKISEAMKRMAFTIAASLFLHSYAKSLFPLIVVTFGLPYGVFQSKMTQYLLFNSKSPSAKRPWTGELYSWRQLVRDVRHEVQNLQGPQTAKKEKTKKTKKPSKYA